MSEKLDFDHWLSHSPESGFWFVDSSGRIGPGAVPSGYESMDLETAREVRDELAEKIEWVENNV